LRRLRDLDHARFLRELDRAFNGLKKKAPGEPGGVSRVLQEFVSRIVQRRPRLQISHAFQGLWL
jgi:hypothetical protein